jgi:sulfur carrier protein ThiS
MVQVGGTIADTDVGCNGGRQHAAHGGSAIADLLQQLTTPGASVAAAAQSGLPTRPSLGR